MKRSHLIVRCSSMPTVSMSSPQIGPEKLRNARGSIVLTPHPGEMSRLLGIDTKEVNADRISAAKKLADMTGAVALLKGSRSVIAAPTGEVYINSTGNPGMGTPGMGDALSGMTGAFLAQRMDALRALALGVFLHGYAADRVAMRYGRVGYIVGDLLDELPRAVDTRSLKRRLRVGSIARFAQQSA